MKSVKYLGALRLSTNGIIYILIHYSNNDKSRRYVCLVQQEGFWGRNPNNLGLDFLDAADAGISSK